MQAVLGPDQLLTEVCGEARVPSAVRERLLVTFMKEQQQLQQQLQQLQQQLHQKLDQETRERARWEVAATRAQFLIERRTQDLLVLKGCMNLRGVLEFVENEAKKSGGPVTSRFKLWQWILRQKPDLKACVQAATSWDEHTIPTKILSLYDTLNKYHHVGKTLAEWTAVGGLRIEEGAKISLLDCRLLYCVCDLYGIKAEVIPAADPMSDSESLDEYV